LVKESLQAEIKTALKVLNERERNVVEAFFGIDRPEMTLEEIGEKYGLTRERVRQIKEKAIRRLRNSTKNKMLKTYLGQ
jgi:RNA polymerase primary sigma factor